MSSRQNGTRCSRAANSRLGVEVSEMSPAWKDVDVMMAELQRKAAAAKHVWLPRTLS